MSNDPDTNDRLTRAVRLAAAALDARTAGSHPSAAALGAYCDDALDEESTRNLRVHLLHCDECVGIVDRLERFGPWRLVLSQFRKLGAQVAGMASGDLVPQAVAAEDSAPAGRSVEAGESGPRSIVVSLDHADAVVVTVEEEDSPVVGARVTLARVSDRTPPAECATGTTDEQGEVWLGRLDDFPPPQRGERYQVTVEEP